MANPVLSDKAFERAGHDGDLRDGWAAPAGIPPSDDPTSPWTPAPRFSTMTVGGSISATAVLLTVLVAFGVIGWNAVEPPPLEGLAPSLPGWIFLPLIGALGVGILTAFKPNLARFTGPVYAALQGLVVGALSGLYQGMYDGIVVQAVGLTVAVTAGMLALYALRIIKVTERFRSIVLSATLGIMLFYGVSILLNVFGVDFDVFNGSALGIGLNLLIVGVAALNLLLDFDFIERGVAAGAPKKMEWYAGWGLMVTIVWLYLELLRLLAQLNRR